MPIDRCCLCYWFDDVHSSLAGIQKEKDDIGCGYCRKHKPIVILKNGRYYGTWPIVGPNDLCGEFRPRKKDTPDNA